MPPNLSLYNNISRP